MDYISCPSSNWLSNVEIALIGFEKMIVASNQKKLIVGAGPTGVACARYLMSLGTDFAIADTRNDLNTRRLVNDEFPEIEFRQGILCEKWLSGFEELIVSPGLPPSTFGLSGTETPKISDISLFRRYWPNDQPLIAITGSNAKSTVVCLVAEILKFAGKDVLLGGNLGPQAISLLELRKDSSLAVLELSSFQLARTQNIKATVSTILNLSPDHLDWHGSIKAYYQAKHNIFNEAESVVINSDDSSSQPSFLGTTPSTRFSVKQSSEAPFGISNHQNQTWISSYLEPWIPISEIQLMGHHQLANVLAAMAITHQLGVKKSSVIDAVVGFRGLDHRSQTISQINDVLFVNDSKGTNFRASEVTVRGFFDKKRRVLLLAGGDSKGADCEAWGRVCDKYCEHVFLFGRVRLKLK